MLSRRPCAVSHLPDWMSAILWVDNKTKGPSVQRHFQPSQKMLLSFFNFSRGGNVSAYIFQKQLLLVSEC